MAYWFWNVVSHLDLFAKEHFCCCNSEEYVMVANSVAIASLIFVKIQGLSLSLSLNSEEYVMVANSVAITSLIFVKIQGSKLKMTIYFARCQYFGIVTDSLF